jgi:hypothetical protein
MSSKLNAALLGPHNKISVGDDDTISCTPTLDHINFTVHRNRDPSMAPQPAKSIGMLGQIDLKSTHETLSHLKIVEQKADVATLLGQLSLDVKKEMTDNTRRIIICMDHLNTLIKTGRESPDLWDTLTPRKVSKNKYTRAQYARQVLYNSTVALAVTCLVQSIVAVEIMFWGVPPESSKELMQLTERANALEIINTHAREMHDYYTQK